MTTPVIVKATPEEAKYVDARLTEFIDTQTPFTQKTNMVFMNYVIKENDVVIAGINADVYYWGILYISELFVDEAFRGRSLGSKLLKHLEHEARAIGAKLSHCDTFDNQAKDFYLKHGYSVFGTLEISPHSHQRYYLRKTLHE